MAAARHVVNYSHYDKQKLSKNIKSFKCFQMFSDLTTCQCIIIILLTYFSYTCKLTYASIATEEYTPKGTNSLLYSATTDKITQLDQTTFDDTIFQLGRKVAYIVEYYADW